MTRTTPHGHVARLEAFNPSRPDPQRVQLIRDWHQAQADADQLPVALLALTITDCGQVKTSGLAIEPEHALIFLGELESVTQKLRSYVEARRAAMPDGADVMRFSRCA